MGRPWTWETSAGRSCCEIFGRRHSFSSRPSVQGLLPAILISSQAEIAIPNFLPAAWSYPSYPTYCGISPSSLCSIAVRTYRLTVSQCPAVWMSRRITRRLSCRTSRITSHPSSYGISDITGYLTCSSGETLVGMVLHLT